MIYNTVVKIFNDTYKKIASSQEEWRNFLKTACRNYKLRFDEQVLVYAQAPEATAVLEAERWSRTFGRLVNPNAKSIFVFESAERTNQRLINFFDISDTTETQFARQVPIWKIDKKDINILSEKISKEYKLETADINSLLTEISKNIFLSIVTDNMDDFVMEQYLLKNRVVQSAAFMIASRLDITDYPTDFSFVGKLDDDEFEDMAILTLNVAKTGINNIAKLVKDINIERGNDYGRADKNREQHKVQKDRGLLDSGLETATTATMGNEILRQGETSIFRETSNTYLSQTADESQISRTFEGSTRTSRSDGGMSDQTDDGARGGNKRTQERKSDGMGRQNEQYQSQGERNSVKRIDLRLEHFDIDNYEEIGNGYISDDIIRKIFATTPFLSESLSDIEQIYNAISSNDDRTIIIESIFNSDATNITLDDGTTAGYKKYENVLRVWLGNEANKTAEKVIKWSEVARYFEAMRLMGELTDSLKPIASPNEQQNLIDELKAEINPSAFVFGQELIDEALKRGSLFEKGKMRIYAQCEKSDSISELANFLKMEYGVGGSSSIVRYTGVGDNHDAKGIELHSKYYNTTLLMNWNQVARHISRLFQEDKYLSENEKEYYNEWVLKEKLRREESEAQNFEIDEKEYKYEYHIGDTVYIGDTKYEIKYLSDEVVELFNADYPLLIEEIERGTFEKRASENFRNEHLKVEVKKKEQINEANRSVAEELVEAVQDTDYYEYLENLDSGETEEDVTQVKVEEQRPERVTDKLQNTPISERHNFNLLINEIKEVGKKERYRRNIDAIKTLQKCETENRFATFDEQRILSNYVGWGGISEAFDKDNSSWTEEYRELKNLLSADEYSAARESTLTAFYTPPAVIESIYTCLKNLGYTTGNILEPSCGIGHFIGMLPQTMQDSKVYGIELDNISANIAQQLYQKSRITASGFENTNLPDNFFDIVVGNVPFGDFKVIDKKYDKYNFLIHDYFFAKSLDKLRAGGVMALITSKGTMDKENPSVRKYIAERAELLGAIRLPNNTFKGNAGTEVVSDILFLKKRERLTVSEPEWIYVEKDEKGIVMNSYFISHPEMILGTMTIKTGRFGVEYTCEPKEGTLFKDELDKAITNIKGKITQYEITEEQIHDDKIIPADPTVRNFSYTLHDGEIYYRNNSVMAPAKIQKSQEPRIKGMIKIRDALRGLIDAQTENYSDEEIKKCQDILNSVYDGYVVKYGRLLERSNSTAFAEDSSSPLLMSLEKYDKDGNFESKADIFSKRTIKPHRIVNAVDTPQEALVLSLSEKTFVDMDFMMTVSGKTEEEIYSALKGGIFLNPKYGYDTTENKYLPADEYLSGNVREKLKQVQLLSQSIPEFKDNVAALEKVQPADLSASEISARLGAIWIEPKIIQQFIFELLEPSFYYRRNIEVKLSKFNGEWYITEKNYDRYNINATQKYGTSRINAYKIIEETLNLRDVRVFDYIEQPNGNRKAVLNKKETAIAQSKQELIKQAFQDWIWKEPNRREHLTRIYNEKYNSIRPREYDGSYLTFSGINPEIQLRKHQKNAIAHILYGGNTLLAHAVGAGKTFEMVAAAMESKRLGLCTKSLFVVPNHLTEQWASEFLTLYPAANILVAKKKDFEPKNRKRFVSKIATGDYDAVIIGHSQFEKIPMSIERQCSILESQKEEIIDGIAELKYSKGDKFTVKAMEKSKKQIEAKLSRLNSQENKDNVITFEELGVDRIFVDEAHYYKNLFLYTKMRNAGGIAQTEAMKSSDLYMKCRYLDEITGGRGVIFATGTPISNSMVELYTMQRYLQYNTLVKNELQHFDAWASTFGETVAAVELTPEGTGYRAKTRFARFNNLPELMSMFKEVADIQTSDMLNLPVPKATIHHIAVKPSKEQKEMVEALAERAERIRAGEVNSNEDNMLIVTNDGRNLALDQRIVNPLLPDFEGSKVNACVENMYQIWLDGKEQKTTQLFFCDLSTPKSDGTFSVYNDIKAKLIAKGIPENEIKFIHDADTEVKKQDVFKKTRSGDVRILMGSTQKMGAGTNVQDRLIALHDLDCPWRPADLEQRLGRIVRQGNQNEEVHIYRYVTEQTFDAYLYQVVEGKQKFASQIMTSKTPVRSCEDIDETALSYAEIKALATGNPHIKEKMDLDIEVQKLRLLKSNYLSEKYSLEDRLLKFYPNEINKYQNLITRMEADLEVANANPKSQGNTFVGIEIMGKYITDKEEAGKTILQVCKNSEFSHIGSYRGFKMYLEYNPYEKTVDMKLKNQLSHFVTLGTDVYGNITRIDNAIDSIENKLNDMRLKLDDVVLQYENAKRDINKPFVFEDELVTKTARLNVLNALLNVDKTENEIISEDASEVEIAEDSISQVPAQSQGLGISM